MKALIIAAIIFNALFTSTVFAGVNKCTVDGKTVYQSQPCSFDVVETPKKVRKSGIDLDRLKEIRDNQQKRVDAIVIDYTESVPVHTYKPAPKNAYARCMDRVKDDYKNVYGEYTYKVLTQRGIVANMITLQCG